MNTETINTNIKNHWYIFILLRIIIGWHFCYEGLVKIFDPSWSSSAYLKASGWIFSDFFHWIPTHSTLLKAVDLLNEWGLLCIGIGLILGLFTRLSCICGMALLAFYYLANPPLGGSQSGVSSEGHYMFINKNIIELVAIWGLMVLGTENVLGVDSLIKQVRGRKHKAKRFFQRAENKQDIKADSMIAESADKNRIIRRELVKNLATLPIIGMLSYFFYRRKVLDANSSINKPDTVSGATIVNYHFQSMKGKMVSERDFEHLAHEYLSSPAWEYINGGAGDGITLRHNDEAYQYLQLNQRTLVDVTRIDTRIKLFGREFEHPIIIAPVSNHINVNSLGEVATARGAGRAKATMIVSTFSSFTLEDIANAATQPLWHATYLKKDRNAVRDILQRVEKAGYEAICIPVDTPVIAARDREHRAINQPVSFFNYPVDYYRFPVSLKDIEWYRANTKLPIILKGIMNSEDAEAGINAGASAIYISNHGGRNLDTVPATIEVLPSIAEKVAGRVPIIIDGGIRRGTDILKALALGANLVGIGRPYIYALAVNGEEGVANMINCLRNELEMAMAGVGCTTIESVDKTAIINREARLNSNG